MTQQVLRLAIASALALTGCGPSIDVDPGEGVGDTPAALPTAEFDPANSILPFPNNLAIDPATKRVALPAQPCEGPASKAVREGVINKLDGFGTYEAAITTTFTVAPDMASAATSVKLYALGGAGATEVPVAVLPGMAIRYKDAASCATPALVPELVVVPMVPLAQKSTYALAVLDTLKTADGQAFEPSATWVLTRSKVEPATFDGDTVTANHTPLDPTKDAATLKALDGLWLAHTAALDAIDAAGHPREHVLVASTFTTATVTDTIDPAVMTALDTDGNSGFFLNSSIQKDGVQFASPAITQQGQGGAALRQLLGDTTCDTIGCDNVGDLLGAATISTQYQTATPNPGNPSAPIPGPFNDPIHPTDPGQGLTNQLGTFIIAPKHADMPTAGWPVVIFGHGLGSKKESLAVFGPQLAGAGFASVAIDFVESGSRAVRTSTTGACADQGNVPPDPTSDAGRVCYGSILSADLAQTRDNIRQTVIDLRRLLNALKRCSTGTGCVGPDGLTFKVDPNQIFYAGISLGGIIGSTFTAVSPEVHAAVLNVPGVGLVDILENTQSAAIRCSLVDGLIAAGILQGDLSSGANPLCLAADQGWKTQPGYVQFSGIARWVLDPADGGNYVSRLATRKILVQEVVDDQVVPNLATDREAAVIGFTAPSGNADVAASATPAPSAAVVAGSHQWVRYPMVPADAATMFPGNTFQHASLLAPAPGVAGQLGTIRVQTDAIAFLHLNAH